MSQNPTHMLSHLMNVQKIFSCCCWYFCYCYFYHFKNFSKDSAPFSFFLFSCFLRWWIQKRRNMSIILSLTCRKNIYIYKKRLKSWTSTLNLKNATRSCRMEWKRGKQQKSGRCCNWIERKRCWWGDWKQKLIKTLRIGLN